MKINISLFSPNYFFPVISKSSGEAIHIEEYVPTSVPNISARENHLRLSGPNKNIATSTINIVNDVKIDRRSVSLIDRSIR
mgnify:CR=1 FL=1